MAQSIPSSVRPHLVCPVCRGDLIDTPGALVCTACELAYPVRDGVPHLVEELGKKVRSGGPPDTAA